MSDRANPEISLRREENENCIEVWCFETWSRAIHSSKNVRMSRAVNEITRVRIEFPPK